MKNGKIGVTTENIFPVIKKFLYSDHEIFLRELISNAVDATQKLKTLSSIGEMKGDLGDLTIRVSADKDAKTLTVTDRGIGMTAEEVDKYINQIAFSGAEEFMEKYKNQAIIGHFGLGFYSSFMVADKVEIITKSWKEGAKTVRWSCTGTPEFEMEETDERMTVVRPSSCTCRRMRSNMPRIRKSRGCCASTAVSCRSRLPSARSRSGRTASTSTRTRTTSSTTSTRCGRASRPTLPRSNTRSFTTSSTP